MADGLLSPDDMMLGNEDVGGYFMTPAAGLLGGMYETMQIPAKVYRGDYGVGSVNNPAFMQAAQDFTIDYGVLPAVGGSVIAPSANTLRMGLGGGKIRAFHGSPHDFDAFDASKIGTGEGAQAYGRGLYFTESEGIAKSYRDSTSSNRIMLPWTGQSHRAYSYEDYDNLRELISKELSSRVEGGKFNFSKELLDDQSKIRGGDKSGNAGVANYDLQEKYYQGQVRQDLLNDITNIIEEAIGGYSSIDDAIKDLTKVAKDEKDRLLSIGYTPLEARAEQNKIYAAIDAIKDLGIKEPPKGKMYEVGILGKKERFLDYDMPLSEQPLEVQNAFKKAYWDNFIEPHEMLRDLFESPEKLTLKDMGLFDNSRGSQAYNTLVGNLGEDEAVKALNNAGIPAIKYTADGSRHLAPDDPDAVKNFVVFDDKMIDIIKKYGLLAPVGAGAVLNGSGLLDVDSQGQQVIY